jgi:hypothetical protein
MRGIVLSLAVLSAVSLIGCSGGGSVLNTSGTDAPTGVIVTTAGSTNIARVLPGASIPLSATAVRGSGVLSNNRFFWTATLVTGGSYIYNTTGQTRPCAQVTDTVGAVTSPLSEDFSIYITIDPTNESNILFEPPTIIPVPAGATAIGTSYPYCVVVTATPLDSNGAKIGGVSGSIMVAVVNPQNPEQ